MQFRQGLYILAMFVIVFGLWNTRVFAFSRPITFPVDGASTFRDDFGEPRGANGERKHLGVDIIADKLTPVVAAVDGVVSDVVSPEATWGYAVTIKDNAGYKYIYLHLNNDTPGTDDGLGGEAGAYAPGIKVGAKVKAGDLIGWVGDSGDAEDTGSHLHFEIETPKKVNINPYESLVLALKSGGSEVGPRLAVGDKGEEVRRLQIKLANAGFYNEEITGNFGPITKSAVLRFQKANGLEPVGQFGPKTRAALNKI